MGNNRLFENDSLYSKFESDIMEKKTGLGNLIEEHQRQFDKSEIFLKTNFKSIDDEINGFNLGELVLITGIQGIGKTSLGLSIIRNMCIESDQSIPSLIVSLDKNKKELLNWIINQKRIDIKANFNKARPYYNIEDLEKIKQSPLYILYPSNNINIIIDNIKKYIRLKSIKLIFIDALDYIDSSILSTVNQEAEYNTILEKLNNLASREGVVIIITSNRNRINKLNQDFFRNLTFEGLENTILEMNFASTVLFVHRPEYFDIMKDEEGNDLTGIAEIFILKSSFFINEKKARLKYVFQLKTFEDLKTPNA